MPYSLTQNSNTAKGANHASVRLQRHKRSPQLRNSQTIQGCGKQGWTMEHATIRIFDVDLLFARRRQPPKRPAVNVPDAPQEYGLPPLDQDREYDDAWLTSTARRINWCANVRALIRRGDGPGSAYTHTHHARHIQPPPSVGLLCARSKFTPLTLLCPEH